MNDASVNRIDHLLITHFDPDHVGGVVELAQLVPIRTFIDHGTVDASKEPNPANTTAAFKAYAEVRSKGVHLQPKPGEKLPITGIDAAVISSAASVIQKAIPSSSQPNLACDGLARSAEEPRENARSTGIVASFGRFRFLDLGDLNRQPLFDLVCPSDRVGPVDVYLVPEHGGADPFALATLKVFKPRVAI